MQWLHQSKGYFWTTKQEFLKSLANRVLFRILNLNPDVFMGRRRGTGQRWARLYAAKLFAGMEKERVFVYQSRTVYKCAPAEPSEKLWRQKNLSQCVDYFQNK